MAKTRYKPHVNAKGEKVPSVTQVSGFVGNKNGLIYWGNQMGLKGHTLQDAYAMKPAHIGTAAHRMVEGFIRGNDPDLDDFDGEIIKEAEICFGAFLRWAEGCGLTPVYPETRLVSEVHQFGGTLDACNKSGSNALSLVDWKTSGSIYAEYLVQVAGGYQILWEENFPDQPLSGIDIIRFGKEHGDFEHRHWVELDRAKSCFLHARQAFDDYKYLESRCK